MTCLRQRSRMSAEPACVRIAGRRPARRRVPLRHDRGGMSNAAEPSSRRLLLRAASGLLVGHEGRIGSTVYGTLLVLTALTASYAAERDHPWKLVELVLTLVLVFWVAYVYAHALSESIEGRSRLDRPTLARIASREFGLVLAAVAPILALILGAVGLIHESASIWLAIGVGLGTLSAQGIRYARATQLTRAGTAAILVMNLVFGLGVVVLKVTLVH